MVDLREILAAGVTLQTSPKESQRGQKKQGAGACVRRMLMVLLGSKRLEYLPVWELPAVNRTQMKVLLI